MPKNPGITGYGWLMEVNGELIEFATDSEATEAEEDE